MRTKAYRRHQADRVQRKRWQQDLDRGLRNSMRSRPEWYTADWVERRKGRLRKWNLSCGGCAMCKPWKHGWGEPLKISVLRQLDSVNDKAQEDQDGRSETDLEGES